MRWSTDRALAVLPGVDGVGEVPGGERPRLAQERLEVVEGDRGPGPVGRGQGVEQTGEPAHVVAQVLGQAGGGGAVESHRAAL